MAQAVFAADRVAPWAGASGAPVPQERRGRAGGRGTCRRRRSDWPAHHPRPTVGHRINGQEAGAAVPVVPRSAVRPKVRPASRHRAHPAAVRTERPRSPAAQRVARTTAPQDGSGPAEAVEVPARAPTARLPRKHKNSRVECCSPREVCQSTTSGGEASDGTHIGTGSRPPKQINAKPSPRGVRRARIARRNGAPGDSPAGARACS